MEKKWKLYKTYFIKYNKAELVSARKCQYHFRKIKGIKKRPVEVFVVHEFSNRVTIG